MKLEKQVVNRELSEKLKELGVKQESFWYWCEERERQGEEITGCKLYRKDIAKARMLNVPDLKTFSAFTVAELGEMLPARIIVKNHHVAWLEMQIQGVQAGWSCQYRIVSASPRIFKFFEDKTMANAGAKMLIYLIENNLLKKEDV